jgi:hypothetical protein
MHQTDMPGKQKPTKRRRKPKVADVVLESRARDGCPLAAADKRKLRKLMIKRIAETRSRIFD